MRSQLIGCQWVSKTQNTGISAPSSRVRIAPPAAHVFGALRADFHGAPGAERGPRVPAYHSPSGPQRGTTLTVISEPNSAPLRRADNSADVLGGLCAVSAAPCANTAPYGTRPALNGVRVFAVQPAVLTLSVRSAPFIPEPTQQLPARRTACPAPNATHAFPLQSLRRPPHAELGAPADRWFSRRSRRRPRCTCFPP